MRGQMISTEFGDRVPEGRRRSRPRSRLAWRPAAGLVFVSLATVLVVASPAAGRQSGGGSGASGCKAGGRTLAASGYKPAVQTYDDVIGESGNAPDFCAEEVVTNDSRTITIGIHAHNRSGFEPGDTYTLFLDTDLNVATGGGGVGADYAITFSGPAGELMRWNGTSFDPGSATTLPVEWLDGYGPAFTFDRNAIDNPGGFNFVLVSSNGQDGDRAPDTGSWSFALTPFTLKVQKLSLGTARAGHVFTARTVVLRSDFDLPLAEGRIACTGTIGGRAFLGSGKFAHNRVVCSWSLPKGARRKQLSGSIAVTLQGVEARRGFAVHIR